MNPSDAEPRPRPDDARPDADLARDAAAGSRDALGALYRRHADAVYRRAYRVTGSTQDAEDVLQDVFVGLARALDGYEERGRFGAWLQAVATRVALMRVRGRARRRAEPLSAAPEPSFRDADAVDRLAVRRALATLPEGQRIVFMLKEIEGYAHVEIARKAGPSRRGGTWWPAPTRRWGRGGSGPAPSASASRPCPRPGRSSTPSTSP